MVNCWEKEGEVIDYVDPVVPFIPLAVEKPPLYEMQAFVD